VAEVVWRAGAVAIGVYMSLGHGVGSGRAAEFGAGGALDLTLAGFVGMLAHGGDLARQRTDPDLADGLDFSNDTEFHVLARARAGELGLDYGATIEFEADTDTAINTDEAWIFLRGGWGEVRVGDVDGPVDASALGAFTIAAGTGGIDGDVVDALAVDAILPLTSDTATKTRYYTPTLAGVQLGIGYTPTGFDAGDSAATTDADFEHLVEAAATYSAAGDRFDLEASVVGGVAELKDGAFAGDRLWTWYAGGQVEFDDLALGAGFGMEDAGGERRRYLNAGIGHWFEPVYASITHGRVLGTSGYTEVGEPWNVVLSADLTLAPGLLLAGDLAYFDNDLDRSARDATGGDSGFAWVAKLEVAF
jgi:hypothetical protein